MTDSVSIGVDERTMMLAIVRGLMCSGDGPGKMPMTLKMIMSQRIGMMLPAIDQDKRGEVAAAILSAIVEEGSVGSSDQQMRVPS